MKLVRAAALAATALALSPTLASAQAVARGDRPIFDVVRTLKNGEYVWAPELAPDGPALVVVNLETQKLVLFRNGVPMAGSTISSGSEGRETPTGVFSILQKNKEHYSKTYNNAPMPNMQRLTWKGIALHAGKLPGYPASHGCIRLPLKFSELLFGATTMGMTVVITSIPAAPQISGEPMAASSLTTQASFSKAAYQWNPGPFSYDPVSVVVSAKDQRAVVLQSGKEIGSAPVRVSGQLHSATAYVLRAWDETGRHWLKLQFSGPGGSMEVDADEEAKKFDTPMAFRQAVAASLRPGSVVIVTPESLQAGSTGDGATVLDADEGAK